MRGVEEAQAAMFSYVSLEQRIPKKHPLRKIRRLVDAALRDMEGPLTTMYSHTGRPSTPPEHLIRALLLQIFFSIRSERLLMEQLDYNLLFRWFVGLSVDDAVWDASVFAKNRDRLVEHEVGRGLLAAVVSQADKRNLISDEHFSVDGTLIQAWASMKSFRPKDGDPPPSGGSNAEVNFRGEKRGNDTHQSTTDPECRLYKKAEGQESKLCYLGHALMENRNGLAVDGCATQANGTAERDAAVEMIDEVET
jgi:transposase